MKTIYNILRLLRPRQWIKNIAIFAAITFSGELFDFSILQNVLIGFTVLCTISSASYIVNDIFDIKNDRLHPFKRFRPLANNDIKIIPALILAIFLISVSLYISI